MPRIELFPFRFRDPLTGKWVRARYRAERHELVQRYGDGQYEITGPPEVREVDPNARYFNPFRDERCADGDPIANVGAILGVALDRVRRLVPIAGTAN